jgi:Tfp pilus assembly protein PilN
MIEINLLPKNYQKKAFDLSFGKAGLYAAVGAAAVVVTLFGITMYQRNQIADLEEKIGRAKDRAAMLQKDIQLVDGLTDVKRKIQNRMSAVERLDSHRSTWIRVLENVTANVPEFIWLSRFGEQQDKQDKAATKAKGKSKEKSIKEELVDRAKTEGEAGADTTVQSSALANTTTAEFEGYAFTLNALASFMINLMRSDYFDDVELITTKEVELNEEKAYNFVVECTVHFLSEEELRQMIGAVDSSEVPELMDESEDMEQLN